MRPGGSTSEWASSRPVAGLAVAQGGDEQDGLTRDVVGEVLEDGQGLRVCPLEVLDDQRGRALAGERDQQAEDGLAEHQPGLRGGDGGLAPFGHQRGQRRDEGRQVVAGRSPNRAAPSSASLIGRSGAPAVGRPTDEHDASLPDRPRAELADQPALADAGRPRHDAHRPRRHATPRAADRSRRPDPRAHERAAESARPRPPHAQTATRPRPCTHTSNHVAAAVATASVDARPRTAL